MAQAFGLKMAKGRAAVNNGTTSNTLVAAQGAGVKILLCKGIVNVTVGAAGGGGIVSLFDGATEILSFDANAVNSYPFDFGDIGYELTANQNLTLTVSGAVTTQATAHAVVICNIA